MSRFQAAFYHLLISLVVFAALAYLVVFVWYPDFFYATDGGWEGMRIIIAVDLVLGPLLTLIVFKAGKKGLKFDLTMIALFQSVCLAAGTYLVYSERPLFFVYYEGHFYSASADTYKRYNVQAPDPANHGVLTPVFVAATVPEEPIEAADFRAMMYREQIPVWTYERSYEPLTEHIDTVLANAYDIEKLRARDEHGELDAWLAERNGSINDYAFFPIHSRFDRPFIAMDIATREFVGVLNVPAPLSHEG